VRILAFDTATTATTTALLDTATDASVEARDDPPAGARPGHAPLLLGQVIDVLRRGGSSWSELDRIAVGVGPGTFTGLRIGVATARALSAARGIPLCGVSSLESLALGAAGEASAVLTAIDARRGEVFAAVWALDGERLGRLLSPPRAVGPDRLPELVAAAGAGALAVGSGATVFRAAFEDAGAEVPSDDSSLHRVTAVHHARLAATAVPSDRREIVPDYLRLADAELALRARSGL
jgi:tRNA threonylcarbamoyladenosine biosynthesis protein TsaB